MRALIVTNDYPTATRPDVGTFVARQVESVIVRGVDVELVHVDRREHGRRVYSRLANETRRRLVQFDPDLVHVMYGGVMADVVTRTVRDQPVVVSFCGADLLREGANTVVDHLSWRSNLVASRRAAARAAGIIVKSHNLKEALPKRVGDTPVWVLPNGIDLSTFVPTDPRQARRKLGWDPLRKHVLFPSSPDRPEKQFGLARAAVDLVNRQRHDVELHALGGVPHEEVPVWLNAADVAILTSRDEGSPNAIKEALACDVAVVSVDVGDVRERIAGIDGCYLADDPSPQAIATALTRALDAHGRIDGRSSVIDLSLERIAARLRDIYVAVTSSTGGAPLDVSSVARETGR
jgi:glycosyltransferase involved in cell wall biosynthesis